MKKGISPIVAVVLLIAIAVIAAVGLYFWVGGLATKQPTPTTPIVISAQKVSCTQGATAEGDSLVALVQNLHASDTLSQTIYMQGDDGTLNGTASIAAGSQATVNFTGANLTAGQTYTIYGTSSVGQAAVIC